MGEAWGGVREEVWEKEVGEVWEEVWEVAWDRGTEESEWDERAGNGANGTDVIK